MQKYNIISIGSCVRDISFYTDEAVFIKNPKKDPTKVYLLGFEYGAKIKSEDVYYSFGGGAANTAVNFSGLGLRAGIIAAVGNDGFGQEIIQRLKNKKIGIDLLQTKKNSHTGTSFLVVDKKTREHFILVAYGANNELVLNKKDLRVHTDWYYVSSLGSKNWNKLLTQIMATKKNIAWNPGATQLKAGAKKLKKYLSHTTVLILNKDEAIELCRQSRPVPQMLKQIYSWGPKYVLITDGVKGAWVYNGHKIYFDQPHHGQPIDTTGAGDCFGSTFIAGLIKTQGDIKRSMHLAMVNASAEVFQRGAQEGLLNWQQLNK